MKKIENILCVFTLFVLVSCGGNKTDKVTADDIKKVVETNVFGERTKDACEAAFDGVGISINDIEPNYKYLDVDTLKIYHGVINRGRYEGSAIFIKSDMSDVSREEFEAYVRKIYALTQTISDTKSVIYGFEKKNTLEDAESEWSVDDILAQKILGFNLSAYDWGWKRDGKFKRMSVELIDANKKYPARLKVHFYDALQKSFDDTMKDAEKALEDPEVQKAIKDAFGK